MLKASFYCRFSTSKWNKYLRRTLQLVLYKTVHGEKKPTVTFIGRRLAFPSRKALKPLYYSYTIAIKKTSSPFTPKTSASPSQSSVFPPRSGILMPLLANIYSSPSPLATQPASPPATEALGDIVTIKRLRRLERHQRTFVVANILLVLRKWFFL